MRGRGKSQTVTSFYRFLISCFYTRTLAKKLEIRNLLSHLELAFNVKKCPRFRPHTLILTLTLNTSGAAFIVFLFFFDQRREKSKLLISDSFSKLTHRLELFYDEGEGGCEGEGVGEFE